MLDSLPEGNGYARALDVLVVDDNRDAADSLGQIVQLMGHRARVAYDGPAALAAARERPPDVVLLDLGLPGMDGWEVARQLRALPGSEKVLLVAVTGYGHEDALRRCREAGIHLHRLKPCDPAELGQVLRSAHGG